MEFDLHFVIVRALWFIAGLWTGWRIRGSHDR